MTKRQTTALIAVALTFAATPALAHGGHAAIDQIGHGLLHLLPWIVGTGALFAIFKARKAKAKIRKD
jgi:hypothetical protein